MTLSDRKKRKWFFEITKRLLSKSIFLFFVLLGTSYSSLGLSENNLVPYNNKSYIPSIKNIITNHSTNLKIPLVVINSQISDYFILKNANPRAANQLLHIIINEDPKNLFANKEMGYLLLKKNELNAAIEYFYNALQITSYDQIIIKQISAIQEAIQEKKIKEEVDRKNGLLFSKSPLVIKLQMNKYFELKNNQSPLAKELLSLIIKEDPNNIMANKEMGYLLIKNNELKEAINYFYNVLQITPYDAIIIKQIGTLQEQIKNSQLSAKNQIENPNYNNEMDYYYQIKKTNPEESLKLLHLLLEKYPDNPLVNSEMGYYLLNNKKHKEALEFFKKSLRFSPQNKVIIAQIKDIENFLKQQSLPEDEQLFNQYYEQKKINPQKAKLILEELVLKYPRNVKAQREMVYSLINDKKLELALEHLLIVEQLTPNDYDTKLQIGYVLASLDHPVKAYAYFDKATKSLDPVLKLKANQAMTNLSGMQTKFLPKPWFADLYLYPLFYSRFDLVILPGIGRIGRTFGKKQQLEMYVINRTTWDNRSGQASINGGLPQVYDDNSIITSLGARYAPFYNSSIDLLKGLKLYADVGRAYNLIKMLPRPNRRWRNDFRGGMLYGYGWGTKHEYPDKITWPFRLFGNIYADISYFTRYNDNIIGYYSLRQGVRLLEYQTGEINFYARARGGFDKNHEFFNNFVEIGPGIELVPNNRYNLSIRFEPLKGYYIPVKSPTKNPYGPNYSNNLLLLEYYALF